MVDYKESFQYAEFWRNEIIAQLKHEIPAGVTFADYLVAFYKSPNNLKTFGIPLPYIYSLDWLKEFKDNCVTFNTNSPDEVKNGAGILGVIYQMSPSLHCLANIHVWRDAGQNDGHITAFFIYERLEEVMNFCGNNLHLVKKEEKIKNNLGFSPGF